MLYKGNDKIGKVYLGDTSIGKIYLGDELVYQKEKPAPKRVKSVTIALPAWGNAERVWWESVPRAVKDTSSGYYLDITIGGVGFRLRGKGGSKRAALSVGSTTAKITLPDNVVITDDKVYSGMSLSLTTKMPSTTNKATYKYSNSSYGRDAFYRFDNAPFIPNTMLKANIVAPRWTSRLKVESKLTSTASTTTSVLTTEINMLTTLGLDMYIYTEDRFKELAVNNVLATWKELKPSVYLTAADGMNVKTEPTLVTPEATHKFSMKVTKVETF